MLQNTESDFPPMVFCANCARVDCEGCAAPPIPELSALAWQEPGGSLFGKLWLTACQTVIVGSLWASSLAKGSVGQALVFAVWVELLAAASLASVLLLSGLLVFPETVGAMLGTWLVWRWVVGVTFGFAALLVGLHLLWAVGLELVLVIGGAPPRLAQSLRFSLYACGWDLITSPGGALMALWAKGRRDGLALLRAGMLAPASATRTYLVSARGVAAQRSRRTALLSFLLSVAVIVFGAAAFLWQWALSILNWR